MKKLFAVITIIIALAVVFTACGKSGTSQNSTSLNNETQSSTSGEQASTTGTSASANQAEPSGSKKDTLVVVFSATGTTKAVAQRIAAAAEADFYEIKAAQEYTSADLNWHDKTTKALVPKSGAPIFRLKGTKPFTSVTRYGGERNRGSSIHSLKNTILTA